MVKYSMEKNLQLFLTEQTAFNIVKIKHILLQSTVRQSFVLKAVSERRTVLYWTNNEYDALAYSGLK